MDGQSGLRRGSDSADPRRATVGADAAGSRSRLTYTAGHEGRAEQDAGDGCYFQHQAHAGALQRLLSGGSNSTASGSECSAAIANAISANQLLSQDTLLRRLFVR